MKEFRLLFIIFIIFVLGLALINKQKEKQDQIQPADIGFRDIQAVSFNYTDSFGSYHCILIIQKGYSGGLWCEKISEVSTDER